MKVVIKTKNIKLNRALEDFIQKKMDDLEKFFNIFQTEKYFNHFFGSSSQILKNKTWEGKPSQILPCKTWEGKGKPRVEAWVEVGKVSRHHQKGPVFWAECQMRFPKRSLRATAQREDLKLAITEIKDKLQRELKQYREKLSARTKRRARIFKKELKLSSFARLNFEKNLGGRRDFGEKRRIKEEGI